MITNFSDLKTQIIVRTGISTSTAYFTDAIVNNWVKIAVRWAEGYRKWPMAEYMDKSGVFTSGTEENSYPNTGFKTDSIKMLKVGDDRFEKVNFKDYLAFREDYSSSEKKIFSDYRRTIYINPNCASGTIYAYGILMPTAIDVTDDSATSTTGITIFSTSEEEGNEAIVEMAMSYLKERERKLTETEYHRVKAKEILDELWKRIAGEQHAYLPKEGEGMFKRVDILEGEYYSDTNNPLQF
mgnify:CR=1 FL=1